MKVAFKVLSIIMIILAGVNIVTGALALVASGAVTGAAASVGGGVGAIAGAAGMIAMIISIAAIVAGALMLVTAINGVRENFGKCKKFTMGFIIYFGISLGLAILFNVGSVMSTFLYLVFMIVYYVLAKCSEDAGGTYYY